MMKKLFVFFAIVLCFTHVNAQEQLSAKQLADKLFERYEYFKAVGLYLTLADKNSPDVWVVERIADCYRLMNNSRNAEQWYAAAIVYKNAEDIDLYYYANALLQNGKLKQAREQYRVYYARVDQPEELRFKLATCDSAEKWMASPRKDYSVKAKKKLNGAYSDWGTAYYGDGGLIFTSDRPTGSVDNSKATYGRTGAGYLKLYRNDKDSVVLLPIAAESKKTFNGDYHAGPAVFNRAADTAWITITTTQSAKKLPVDKRTRGVKQRLYTRRLMLVMATKTNGIWGSFKNFPCNNTKEYSVGHAALSNDGSTLYFTSDMPGGEGKTDIWYCTKQADGTWGQPVNCGKAINTQDEEAFPVTQGADVLIYASKGFPGMGGFDVFTAVGKGTTWSIPQNYRYPVNSTADDFYFVTRDGLSGYFSTNREGGAGSDDIYSFSYQPAPAVIASTPAPAAQPAQGHVYAIIYYDLDKANIRADAISELDKLVLLLKANLKVKIKLASYTDVRASGDYNIGLSKRRSDAAMEYLLSQGISADRLSTAWFGEAKLVNNCPDNSTCTEAEHQLNRRTEIIYDGMLN